MQNNKKKLINVIKIKYEIIKTQMVFNYFKKYVKRINPIFNYNKFIFKKINIIEMFGGK